MFHYSQFSFCFGIFSVFVHSSFITCMHILCTLMKSFTIRLKLICTLKNLELFLRSNIKLRQDKNEFNILGCYGQKIDGASNIEIIGKDIFFEIVEPENLRYTYRTRPAKNFGTQFNNGFLAKNIKLVPVDPPNGCSWPNNAHEISGNVAFVERGQCSFLSKTLQADQAGAKAIIISDNMPSDEFYTEMIDDLTDREVNIPATFLLGKNGFVIRNTLKKLNLDHAIINIPVNVSFVPLPQWKQPPWLTW